MKISKYLKLQLTKDCENAFKRLQRTATAPDYHRSDTLFANLFDSYGTHLTTAGIIGAFKKTYFSIHFIWKEKIEENDKKFDTSSNVGISSFLLLDYQLVIQMLQRLGNTIVDNVNDQSEAMIGDIKDLLATPGVISREITPICEFID